MDDTRDDTRTRTSPGRTDRWTFLTGHAHALIVIAREPDVRVRDIAVTLGVTERTAQAIVNDLAEAGYVVRTRVGNRSHYEVNSTLPFRHPVERDHAVGALLGVLAPREGESAGGAVGTNAPGERG